MKTVEAIQNNLNGLVELIKSPDGVAQLYSELSSDEQAKFWDNVARNFSDFGGARGCYQNANIAIDLSDRAKEYIKNLAEHIRLLEQEA